MTARARSRRVVPSPATIGQNEGPLSRALLVTLSMPWRLMRVTFAPVSMTAAISGVARQRQQIIAQESLRRSG